MNDETQNNNDQLEDAIAIIGMACHFPDANTLNEFWHNLENGHESVRYYDDAQLMAGGVSQALIDNPDYVKSGIELDNMEFFDAHLFGLSPKDASIMDPQHRHFLETAWQALEHSGYDPDQFDGAIGVFGGSGHNAYMPFNLLTNPELMAQSGFFLVRHTSNDKDFLTTRVSYQLNLTGPSINVQTACSTSLVAIHLATLSLLEGECDMALAGGVTLELPHRVGYLYKEGEILSPDGHCHAFDAQSKGTIFGSGSGIVVLKRLSLALEHGDTIHAIIRGTAINNDGADKIGYMAPSVEGQAKAVAEAIEVSGVDPETIGYIECHGTGTPVGDPIEIAALTQAYRQWTNKNQFCAIGSVKTNIGHLDTAAGVASVIKTTLALKARKIPPSLNYQSPNPAIDFANSPFFVADKLINWVSEDQQPLRAGISSLGVGGTNAHLILEQAPVLNRPSSPSRTLQLMLLSAKNTTALQQLTDNMKHYLKENPTQNLADICYTLRVGRKALNHRRLIIAKDHQQFIEVMDSNNPKSMIDDRISGVAAHVIFMFTGQGAQTVGMGRELYLEEPVFKEAVDECAQLLYEYMGIDIRQIIYPNQDDDQEGAQRRLLQTSVAQPALFVTEYALAQLIMSWGIKPSAMIGHSLGEYVAACISGVFSLPHALEAVAKRGQLMQTMPKGGMLSVNTSEANLKIYLADYPNLSLAAVNNAHLCVVAGEDEAIDKLSGELYKRNITTTKLHTSHAFHSSMMDPIIEPFVEFMQSIPLNAPSIAFISNITGTWISEQQATGASYWGQQIRHTVRFNDGLDLLLAEQHAILLELGPGQILSKLAEIHEQTRKEQRIIPLLSTTKSKHGDYHSLLTGIGRYWLVGGSMNWSLFHQKEQRYRIPLPTYPFDRKKYWIEPGAHSYQGDQFIHDAQQKLNFDQWFHLVNWQIALTDQTMELTSPIIVIYDKNTKTLCQNISSLMEPQALELVLVELSDKSDKISKNQWLVNLAENTHQEIVGIVKHYISESTVLTAPLNILYLPSFAGVSDLNLAYQCSFDPLIQLAKQVSTLEDSIPIMLTVVSNGVYSIATEPVLSPVNSVLLGPVRVINREFKNINCRHLDFHYPSVHDSTPYQFIYKSILSEWATPFDIDEESIVYRGRARYKPTYNPLALSVSHTKEQPSQVLRENGVYLLTGGFGGIGYYLAQQLVAHYKARLVLFSRKELPESALWDNYMYAHPADDPISLRIKQIRSLENQGAQVLVLNVDVTQQAEVAVALETIKDKFGQLHGVFHTAGTIDDKIISLKNIDAAHQVMSSKIEGTLVLDATLKNIPLDFLVLFSSVSALAGIAGQVDYTAANAFLDSYSHFKQNSVDYPIISINWGTWQDIGMAIRSAQEQGLVRGKGVKHNIDHGIFAHHEVLDQDTNQYSVLVSPQTHWVLDQHRTKAGLPLIPGTAYLQFAYSAFTEYQPDKLQQASVIDLENVFFLSPFVVADGYEKYLNVKLIKEENGHEFIVSSQDLHNNYEQEHVRGQIGHRFVESVPRINIEHTIMQVSLREVVFNGQVDHPHLKFGSRWQNVQRVLYGQEQALVFLQLPIDYTNELNNFLLHPALLDMATGAAQELIPNFNPEHDFFVPVSYRKIRVYGPLKDKLISHVRYIANNESGQHNARFDIAIADEHGEVLIEIEQFIMHQVEHNTLDALGQETTDTTDTFDDPNQDKGNALLESIKLGIDSGNGFLALRTILDHFPLAQVIVSSEDFKHYLKRTRQSIAPIDTDNNDLLMALADRPELSTDFQAPETELEMSIVNIWQQALGLKEVGVRDNFFELGGHSLLLTQMVSRVRKVVAVDLPIAELFDTPTIKAWADLANRSKGSGIQQIELPQVMPVDRELYRRTRSELEAKV